MVRTLYVSVVLALLLVAGQTEGAATGTKAMARRQPYGGPPFIPSTGYSTSSSSYSESYHYETVTKSFNGLLGNIQNMQSYSQQSSFSEQIATQNIQQIAGQFESALNQFQSCRSCINQNQIVNFRGTFTDIFRSFEGLIQTYQQRFPEKWHLLFENHFTHLQEEFELFFNTCQGSGLPISTFVPPQMGSFFSKTSMTSTVKYMQQVGYQF